MFQIDLSKVLPQRTYELLANFIPGLFFCFSVLLANPNLAAKLSTTTNPGLTLGRYGTIAMLLFLAFVIGSGFILVDTIAQFLLFYLYRLKMSVFRLLCKWPLQQILQHLVLNCKLRWNWLRNEQTRVGAIAASGFQNWLVHVTCWRRFARRLIDQQYGVNPDYFEEAEWQALYSCFGELRPQEVRGSMFLIACHATGWAGLLATRIAPILRNKYYLLFCVFLIFNGLLHAYYVAKRKYDPRFAGLLSIRGLLREFPRDGKAAVEAAPEPNV